MRVTLRLFGMAAMALGALAVAQPVVAQDFDWGWYGSPRVRPRQPQRVEPWYDEPVYEDDRYIRRYRGQRWLNRHWRARRYEAPPGVYREEEDDESTPLPRSRRWQDRDDAGQHDQDDQDARRRPQGEQNGGRETDEEGRITASGGAQPYIEPKAPPVVAFAADHAPGSIVIDTSARKLYYVRPGMSAFAYQIGVGRDGFSWTGTEKVSRVADWPDWFPPAEMRERKPELPEKMTGGLNNPLGAKAIYLGNTLYRIHGTNDPKSIGRAESSGCFRMLNAHVLHLASLVQIGAGVTVVRSLGRPPVTAAVQKPRPRLIQPAPPPRVQPRVRWQDNPDPAIEDYELR